MVERDWKPERGNSTRRRGDAEEDAENALRMGGRRVPGGGERVKGIRSAETAEDGSLRAGAEGFPESSCHDGVVVEWVGKPGARCASVAC